MRNKGQNQSLRSRRILGTHGVPRPSPTAWVLITIDTDNVKATYPGPSQDQNNPTRIAHNMGFMVGPEAKVKSGKRTGDLSVTAQVGDTVYAFATSGSDNFEDAVLLYAIVHSMVLRCLATLITKAFRNLPWRQTLQRN